ncbi:putative phosphoserine phosphatase 2 [mine drainage metagenome]|uniref:Putative phosphoserine phosphatase 2 n=1 Tax=mine drainage metagenome TaxID=410659 RepID=A0A1J5QJF7_9ZZZZ
MTTIVHFMRHGEVHNPEGILYGRIPGYSLSPLGVAMAERVAAWGADRDIKAIHASPLTRAQETAAPLAALLGLSVTTDERLIEAANIFEGKRFSVGDGVLRRPSAWRHLWNPFKPSWGEPYTEQVARMLEAAHAARVAASGHEAICVSHQLPIWILRSYLEGRHFLHDPRRRECTLASLTSIVFNADGQVTDVRYSEPARDLLPKK